MRKPYIQIFLETLRRFCAKKKWIWLFALTFVSIDQAKENKNKNFLYESNIGS